VFVILNFGHAQRRRLRRVLLFVWYLIFDGCVKSPKFVMPDLIRHPKSSEITGFRLSPE